MEFQELFPARYEVEVLDLVPERAYVFGRGGSSRSGDVVVAVGAGELRWTGIARAGEPSLRGALSAVLATPDPRRLCIVARGDAYLIEVGGPERFVPIDTSGSVVQAYPVREESLLLLATPWTITALGEGGVRWRTHRLAIEGIRLDEVEGRWLAGVADPDDDEPRDFCVDLATGSHQGGVPFD